MTESVPMRERILDDHSEQVTESSEDSLPCSVGQESQEVITSDENPHHEEAFPEKHGILPQDEVMTSPTCKAPPEKSDSVGLQVKLHPPPLTVNELLCFVQNKVAMLPKDNLVQLCANVYSIEAISTAKQVLFTMVNTRHHFVTCKGMTKA